MSSTHDVHGSEHVLKTPIWMTVIRGIQFLLSLIIVGLAGALMHDAYLDEHGFAVATSILTWVIVAYIVVTEKFPAAQKAYHVIAVLALDGFMVIMWLATFAAVAAKRAGFVVDVDVDSCYSDGSLIDSKTCFTKRGVILFESGLAMMAAAAGLGALVWLLFIATFAWGMTMFFRGRKQGRFLFKTSSNEHQMESQPHGYSATVTGGEKIGSPEQQPLQTQTNVQYQPQANAQYQPPVAGTYPPQAQYPQGQHPQGQYPQAAYQPPVSPSPVSAHHQYQAPAPYSQAQELHGQQHQQQAQELHGQQHQQQGYPAQQYGYPQQTTTPHSSELEGQVHQQYEMPSPPTASPPPQQYHQ